MSIFTTLPPPRPPPPKYPLFTTKFFSTKSFSPGHIVGAGVLVIGTVALTKLFIARGKAESERVLRTAVPSARPEDEMMAARSGNERGQYGKNNKP
jgi:hypothetical protein